MARGKLADAKRKPITVVDFLAAKQAGRRLAMLTVRLHHGPSARRRRRGRLLVGDSLGMVMQKRDVAPVSMTT